MTDNVNSPAHYTHLPNGVEVIDLTEGMGFCLGNVIKYVMRCDHKGAPIEDLRKAAFYLDRELKRRGYEGSAPAPSAEVTCAPPLIPLESAVRVEDRDGDEWERLDSGRWWTGVIGRDCVEDILEDFGPLRALA